MRIINGQESNNVINRNNMDENSLSHQNGSIIGGGNSQNAVNTNNMTNKAGGDETNGGNTNNMAQYTIPGVLHYIQHEWARFELERSQWDVDRAELQAKIGVLIGERKGQESLKSDLIRRIKMLEYALKQERAKYYRLKYGADPPLNEVKSPTEEGVVNEVAPDPEGPFSPASNITWRQGRQLLRQYLQEIGYTDTIIDVRSNRVRSLLGLNSNQEQEENVNPNINGTESGNKRASESQAKKTQQTAMTEAMLLESEAAVLANFEFLAQADVEMSDDDDMENDLDIVTNDDESDVKTTKRRTKQITLNDDDVDAEADEVLNELNLITEGENANLERSQDNNEWSTGFKNNKDIRRQTMPRMSGGGADEEVDQSLGLGELAQLTITNEAEQTYDMANSKEPFRKTWNAKYTLRSHFDCVRALAFHPQDQVLITASEDHTLKLWNLQKTVPAKKQASLDVEPLYTFRGHTGPVLCLAMSATGEQCYSGSLDSTINVWQLPNSNIDPYDNYDADVLRTTLEGHKDAVWGLAVNHAKESVLSCSADGTVKLWSPNAPAETSQLLGTYTPDTPTPEDIPTSIDFVRDELDKLVAAYQNSNCVIYDTETRKVLLTFDAQQEVRGNFGKYINKVISHPTLPIVITAHEDRHIRFWDTNTGSLIHAMVAHLDAVTSLAIDAHGLYLLSGSQDCSIRLWHMENKTCVQEITAHRKKFDESILDVAFHPSKPLIASAGADAIAKVFV